MLTDPTSYKSDINQAQRDILNLHASGAHPSQAKSRKSTRAKYIRVRKLGDRCGVTR